MTWLQIQSLKINYDHKKIWIANDLAVLLMFQLFSNITFIIEYNQFK